MEITYNNKSIQYNQFFTPTETNNKPSIKISDMGYKFYTVIMYDPDAVNGTYLHWILANTDTNVSQSNSNTLLSYEGPNPPDLKKHRYIFELYGTNEKINVESVLSRNIGLEKGKQILNLESNPIISTTFLSEKEKDKGGSKTRTRKKRSTKRRPKY
jgi:phosphatidylethanolamine-binding protein (PEBP) family uncharacterized protein